MKCPKCGYLGFEDSQRCRNCGFEFSLAPQAALPDAYIHPDVQSDDRNADLFLTDVGQPPPPSTLEGAFDLRGVVDAPGPGAPELPLFGGEAGGGGHPRITAPPRPRPPLAVRRATPEVPKARTRTPRPASNALDLVPLSDDRGAQSVAAAGTAGVAASTLSRVMAACMDAAILGGVDSAIVYFTLRLCGLQTAQLLRLPLVPLLAFLAIVNGGYFVAFTAVGGQSIGKMAFGIRVVGEERQVVSLGRATVRVLVGLLSVLPFGLGLVAALPGPDHRPLHDRFAHTRVVRLSPL